ncbi:hypothetical protein DSL72_001663 [Monilinia vaccinii-corymbosi]|uniref:Uncharacterized protein n=1 Tax=Monilinia vaccinii-corymbosi TaxID=61207 RepID=A0A8A3P6A6_9HELO|nr:hypothetical protein DSL72_001663 [Monilinia vaccinii-corymbosi]
MAKEQVSYSGAYNPPTKVPIPYLPPQWTPYAELLRIHKPAGILYVYFPYLFGSLFAASIKTSMPSFQSLIITNFQLFILALIIRGAGCTWNDIVDCELDRHVARCRIRPIARGALSPNQGYIFIAFQYLFLLFIATIAMPQTLKYLVPIILTTTFYPYAKRITNYAQVVLGVALSLGILAGSSMMGVNPLSMGLRSKSSGALFAFAISNVVWTVIYDTIYAFQDIEDDERAGVKAVSVRHKAHMRPLLFSLSVIQVALLVMTGVLIEANLVFFVGVACTAVLLFIMTRNVDLEDPKSCGWWFKYGSLLVGGSLILSLQGEYFARLGDFGV